MDGQEFIKAMTYLGVAYNKEFTQEQIKIWYSFFKEEKLEVFVNAIKRIVSKSKFLPSVADLKQEINLLKNPTLSLDVEEEWNKVLYVIRNHRLGKDEEEKQYLGEFTARIIDGMGWERLMQIQSKDIGVEHNRFKQMFESYQMSYSNSSVLNNSVRNLLENKRMDQLSDLDKELINKSNMNCLLIEEENDNFEI